MLIDCPPALGLLTVNGLVAADHALISTEAQYFSLQGVEQALEVIELAKENLHPELEWLGVVLNIADLRTVHSREALAQLRERFGDKVFDSRRSASRSATRSRPSAACRSSTTRRSSAPTTSRSARRCSRAWASREEARRVAAMRENGPIPTEEVPSP